MLYKNRQVKRFAPNIDAYFYTFWNFKESVALKPYIPNMLIKCLVSIVSSAAINLSEVVCVSCFHAWMYYVFAQIVRAMFLLNTNTEPSALLKHLGENPTTVLLLKPKYILILINTLLRLLKVKDPLYQHFCYKSGMCYSTSVSSLCLGNLGIPWIWCRLQVSRLIIIVERTGANERLHSTFAVLFCKLSSKL